jgi:radical SAM superfamily enzyme YgiQ (UPF0313 family)
MPKPRVLLVGDSIAPGVLSIASEIKNSGAAEVAVETRYPPWSYVLDAELSFGGQMRQKEINKAQKRLSESYDKIFEEFGIKEGFIKRLVPKTAINPNLLTRIGREKPNIVGMATYDDSLPQLIALGLILPRFSDSFFLIGGPAVILNPIHMLVHTRADFVLSGEADRTAVELVKIIGDARPSPGLSKEQKKNLAKIPGLYMMGEEGIIDPKIKRTHLSESELSGLRIDYSLYGKLSGKILPKTRNILISTSRGCPYDCIFCSKVHGYEFRAWSPVRIMEEIERIDDGVRREVLPKTVDGIEFTDDDFLLNQERAIEFFRLFSKSPFRKKFRLCLQTNVASFFTHGRFNDELLSVMAEAGVYRILIGTDHFTDAGLSQLGKPYDMRMVYEAAQKISSAGIAQEHYVILTNLDSRPIEILECIENVRKLNSLRGFQTIIIKYIQPFPGTKSRRRAIERGLACQHPVNRTLRRRGFSEYDYDIVSVEIPADPVVAAAVAETPDYLNYPHLKLTIEGDYIRDFARMRKALAENVLKQTLTELSTNPPPDMG